MGDLITYRKSAPATEFLYPSDTPRAGTLNVFYLSYMGDNRKSIGSFYFIIPILICVFIQCLYLSFVEDGKKCVEGPNLMLTKPIFVFSRFVLVDSFDKNDNTNTTLTFLFFVLFVVTEIINSTQQDEKC